MAYNIGEGWTRAAGGLAEATGGRSPRVRRWIMKVITFGQVCGNRSGTEVPQSAIAQFGEECNDYERFDGTPEEALAYAKTLIADSRADGGYRWRLARTLVEAVQYDLGDWSTSVESLLGLEGKEDSDA